ncbi:PIG-L deacetylase family protein [Streptomyces sp. AC558_RSS880]|uniref:PIG-L deacetylase family protein n=1 Tax=Streptomyces sp. AC558_RSS880 TaxID=2823687 RepID=UPI001C236D50|nr:PIG-L deacetylase family protein [Streptomyces sp. AC558_RSS880]
MTDGSPTPLRPMPDDWRRALAVVAHPDDLEYGCSAAVASWVADGRQITYVLATRGEAGMDTMTPERARSLREAEQRAAAAAVGVRAVEFLDHRDGVIEYGIPLRRDIAGAVRRHRPELVITLNHRDTWASGAWNTPDHVAVGRAVLDAVADAGNRWIFPELTEQGLRPWDGVRWVAVANSPTPSHAVPAEAGFEQGVRSLLRHRAYLEALTEEDPETYARRFLADNTRVHSSRFAGEPAVAFELFSR